MIPVYLVELDPRMSATLDHEHPLTSSIINLILADHCIPRQVPSKCDIGLEVRIDLILHNTRPAPIHK